MEKEQLQLKTRSSLPTATSQNDEKCFFSSGIVFIYWGCVNVSGIRNFLSA